MPLCSLPAWRDRPHAWPKLWKHHAAQHVADRLNEVASERKETFLARYGGRISSEWYFPKLIEIWLEDREIYDAAGAFLEATDWVVWYLCGQQRRSACPAAYKAMWSEVDGLPALPFLKPPTPGSHVLPTSWATPFTPWVAAPGTCGPTWRAKWGLASTVAVAVGNVDSFVSFPGAGAEGSTTYVMVIGTSICDLVVHPEEVALEGITGVAKDGIIPGLYGYEAGQPAVGDMFGWFAENLANAGGPGAAAGRCATSSRRPPPWPRPRPGWSPWTGGTATAASSPTPTCRA